MLLFADDIVLMAQGSEALNQLLQILREFLLTYGLTLSVTKTKWMELRNGQPHFVAQHASNDTAVKYGDAEVEQVDLFKYLGLWFNHDASATLMCAKRIEAGR